MMSKLDLVKRETMGFETDWALIFLFNSYLKTDKKKIKTHSAAGLKTAYCRYLHYSGKSKPFENSKTNNYKQLIINYLYHFFYQKTFSPSAPFLLPLCPSKINMSSLRDQIDLDRLPRHIAIIMDGNGRWAQEKGQDRLYGHFHGVESVRNSVEGCAELGVGYLTLYAFSTENWDRPQYEVTGLMELLAETIRKETETLNRNNIKLHVIGDRSMLPEYAKKALDESLEITSQNTGLNLIMALSYSSRWELVIRTSGEYRISNFLLYQLAYAELYVTNVRWPDFRKENLYEAILDYQGRERRFGKTSKQIQQEEENK